MMMVLARFVDLIVFASTLGKNLPETAPEKVRGLHKHFFAFLEYVELIQIF